MVTYCCAYGCKEKFVKGGPYTFHRFPRDESRIKEWIQKLRRENFTVKSHTKICSKHFKEECFDKGKFGGTWQKSEAIPTIFDFPAHLLPKDAKSRHKRKAEDSSLDISVTSNQKRFAYIGDFSREDMNSTTKTEKLFQLAKENHIKQRKEIASLQQKTKRLKKRIVTIKEILRHQAKSLISENACSTL